MGWHRTLEEPPNLTVFWHLSRSREFAVRVCCVLVHTSHWSIEDLLACTAASLNQGHGDGRWTLRRLGFLRTWVAREGFLGEARCTPPSVLGGCCAGNRITSFVARLYNGYPPLAALRLGLQLRASARKRAACDRRDRRSTEHQSTMHARIHSRTQLGSRPVVS